MTMKPKNSESNQVEIDYQSYKPVPDYVHEAISEHLAIELEDAKTAGALGYMTRALVMASLPYKDPKSDTFTRTNGDFKLRIVAGYEGGIPYGVYPRILTSWVVTEAVRTQSPVIHLGDSLNMFLRDVIKVRSQSGGKRGTSTRVTEQMKRLFGALITAQYSGTLDKRGFILKNVLLADEININEDEVNECIWTPLKEQEIHNTSNWKSTIKLSTNFYKECVDSPVPIDLRAYMELRSSPAAMDLYSWLTFRMSYLRKKSLPIPWEALMMQFGTGLNKYGSGSNKKEISQGIRNFRTQFTKALKLVTVVYKDVNVEIKENGLVLLPSPTHIPKTKFINVG